MRDRNEIINHSVFITAAGLVLASSLAVSAQGRNCAPHTAVVQQLADRYGEQRQSIGLSADNTIMEIFASPETGTWSITATKPGGLTCLVAAGEAFQQTVEPAPTPGDPA